MPKISVDESWQIIKSFKDTRIRAFRNSERRRGAFGINKAISKIARGDYIAIHHSDDLWEPHKLEHQILFLDEHPEIGAVFTNASVIGEEGTELEDSSHFYYKVFEQQNRSRYEWLNYFFYHGNVLCHPSVLIRKKCYFDCGLYRPWLGQTGDFDMWVRLCLKYNIHILQEKLVKFRVRANEANTSGSRTDSRIRGMTEFYYILKNYLLVKTFDELAMIFPEAQKYLRTIGFEHKFVLAMICLEDKSLHWAKLFGLELLFELLGDPEKSKKLKEIYNFDYLKFIALTGNYDVFSLEAIAKFHSEAQKHQAALTEWANTADVYAKSLEEELTRVREAYSEESRSRAAENIQIQEQVAALTEWAKSAETYAKSLLEELERVRQAYEEERKTRAAEHAEAQRQISTLKEWATSSETYAKSSLEEKNKIQRIYEAERNTRVVERLEAEKQINALTEWATGADIYAKSLLEEQTRLRKDYEDECKMRILERKEGQKRIAALNES